MCAIATTAGNLLPPDLVVICQNLSLRKQLFLAVPRSVLLPTGLTATSCATQLAVAVDKYPSHQRAGLTRRLRSPVLNSVRMTRHTENAGSRTTLVRNAANLLEAWRRHFER